MKTLQKMRKSFKINHLRIIFSAKTNLLISCLLFLFLSTQLRLGSNIHMKTKSTTMCILIGRGFPPTHFPAPIKSNIRTSKYQDIKISGRFPAVFLKKLCMLARVILLSRPTFLREQEEDEV